MSDLDQIPAHLECVGAGWRPILERLHEQVVALVPEYRVGQVKEKFGELRVYLSPDPDLDQHIPAWVNSRVHGLVDAAEEESGRTCEACGETATPTGKGGIKTLCQRCAGTKRPRER